MEAWSRYQLWAADLILSNGTAFRGQALELRNVSVNWHSWGVQQTGVFGKTILIVGPESLLAERQVTRFIKAALAERPGTGVNKVQAAELDAGALAEISGGSLLSTSTVTVIDGLADLPPEVADRLVKLAGEPGPDLALAIIHPGGVKGKAVLDRLKKARVELIEIAATKAKDLPQFAMSEARRLKGKLDLVSASVLVEAVGSDLRTIASAVRQLLEDSEDRQITEQEVRKYFSGRAELTTFSVAEDAVNGNTGQAMVKLRWALATGATPVMVTAAFSSTLRSLGKYLDNAEPHISDNDLAQMIGVPYWKVPHLAKQARNWPESAVAKAIKAVAVADAQVKGAAVDPGFALEQLVIGVSALRRR